MADDDLLLTNKYAETYLNEQTNNETFSKLMQAKNASKVYNKDPPQFTDEIETEKKNIGVGKVKTL